MGLKMHHHLQERSFMSPKINVPNHTLLLTDSRVQSAFKNILVRTSVYKNLEEWNLLCKIIKINTMRKRFCKL